MSNKKEKFSLPTRNTYFPVTCLHWLQQKHCPHGKFLLPEDTLWAVLLFVSAVDVMVCATNTRRVVGPRSRHCNKGKFRVVFYSCNGKCTSDLWEKAANQSNREKRAGKQKQEPRLGNTWIKIHTDNKTGVKHISF